MGLLNNLYQKYKKKLEDWEKPATKQVSSGLSSAYNSAKNSLNSVESFAKKNPTPYSYVAPKVSDYFNNDATIGGIMKNTFKPSNLADSLMKVPEHKFNFAEKVSWKNPAIKLPAEMAQGAMNTFHNVTDYAKEASDQYYGNKKYDFGSLAGKGLGAALDLGGLAIGGGKGEKLLKTGAKTVGERMAPSLKSAIWQGAKDTSKIMGRFGAGYSLADSLKNHESLPKTAMNVAQGYAGGRIAGRVIGGGLPAAGALGKAAVHDIKVRMGKKYGPAELIPKRIWQTHENNPELMIQGSPQRRELPSPVRKPSNLPIEGDQNYKVIPEQKFDPDAPQLPNVFRQVGEALPRPGMTIKEVPNANLDARISQKRARAAETIGKQIDNQKAGSNAAEPGFVPPQKVKAPETKKPLPPIEEYATGKTAKPALPSIEEFVNGPSQKDKSMAKALGLPEKKIPVEDNPFGDKEYNYWQKKAYSEKGERIKSIGDVLNEPKALRQSGYRKFELSKMSPEEAKIKGGLLDLGYPKNIVERLDIDKAKKLIDSGVQYRKMPEHIIDRYSKSGSDIPRYMNQDIKDIARQAEYLAGGEGEKDFRNIFGKWIGERDAAKTAGMKIGVKYRETPKEMGWEVIDNLEHPEEAASQGAKTIGGMIRNELDNLHNAAEQAGMKVGYWWDYMPHIWKESPEQVQQIMKGAGRKFQFANERDIPTYREGINMGLTPKYNHPAPIMAEYVGALEKTKANIRFINDLKNKGLIVDAAVGERQSGFLPLTGPGFPKSSSMGPDGEKVLGTYYAPKEIADKINSVFSPQSNGIFGKTLELGSKISGGLQDITLSGGIPKTPVNAWTFAQTTKEILSGRIKSPVTTAFRSLSGKASNQFFENNADQISKMQKLGISMNTTFDAGNLMDEGFLKNAFTGTEPGFVSTVKSIWNKTVNEPTFKRFMPMLQVNLFNDIERKAMKAGRSANEASQIAANAVKNFYGVTDSGSMALRAKIGKDATGTFFFAPRYRESMINFWAKNIKAMNPVSISRDGVGLKNNWWLENQTNLKFMAGAAIAYGMYNKINHALTGRDMSDNPPGMEDKLLIPVGGGRVIGVPYLSSIATMPRLAYRVGKSLARGDLETAGKDAFQGTVSMSIKPVADIVANSDYYGNEIYSGDDDPNEKIKKQAQYLFKQYGLAHPYLKTLASTEAGNEILKSIGLGVENFKKKPGYQLASEAMEAPFRFYDQNKLASSEFWDKKTEAELAHNKFRDLVKTDTAKANEFYSQNKELIDAYPKLNDMVGMYSGLKKAGEKDQFGGIMKDMGFGLIKTPVAEASSGEDNQTVSTNGMSSDAQKIIKNFEVEKKKEELLNSGKKYMEYDGRIYIVNESGNISSKSKDEYESLVYGAQLTNLKRNENYEKWKEIAHKQLEKFSNQLNDPEIDEYSKIKVQDDIDRLVDDYQKFAEYGGFTKPKKGKKLEEKYRYPLVDPDFMKIEMLLSGTKPRKIRVARRPLPLIRRSRTRVRRRRLLR